MRPLKVSDIEEATDIKALEETRENLKRIEPKNRTDKAGIDAFINGIGARINKLLDNEKKDD